MDQPSTAPDGMAPKGAAAGNTREKEERHAHLLNLHVRDIRLALAKVEEARGPLTEAQEALTAAYNAAKAELGKGYTRKYLSQLVEDTKARARDQVAEEARRMRDRVALGLPVHGVQQDLFSFDNPATPDEAKDELAAEAEGYLRGRRGDLKIIQDGDQPRFHQAIQRGFDRGQRETQAEVEAAMLAKKAMASPDPDAEPKNLNPPEPGTPEAAAAERKSVRRAKESLGLADAPPANKKAA